MGFPNWIVGVGRRGSNAPLSFDEWLATPPPKIAAAINRHLDREIARRHGSNPPAPGSKHAAPAAPPEEPLAAQLIRYWAWEGEQVRVALSEGSGSGGPVTPEPPIKPQPTGGRLIYGDRDPGPVPPRLPDDPADLPSDELMQQWRDIAYDVCWHGGEATWHTAALLAFAEGRRQAQSLQIPPPGADPVATTENLWDLWASVFWADSKAGYPDARRALYNRGRADERTAILRALGVKP